MEKTLKVTIRDFGGRVASVWEGMRPTTRSIVERALTSAVAAPVRANLPYDARAEWELSRLLAALDDRVEETNRAVQARSSEAHDARGPASELSVEQARELARMAETCAAVLQNQAQSAEVFAQLIERALNSHDYMRVDALADTLAARLAPSETCEMTRNKSDAVRAIARETLSQSPTSVLVELLNDPVDSEAARHALERQADDYGSEEARWVLGVLERLDAAAAEDSE